MSTDKGAKPISERERLEDIIKAAHRERAEAIKQLFGFGFGAVKEKVATSLKPGTPAHAADATARG